MTERRTGELWRGLDAASSSGYGSMTYEVIETDEFQMGLRAAYTKRGAERKRTAHVQLLPTYHLRVERITRNPFKFDRWAVNAYQNRLEPVREQGDGERDPTPPEPPS